MIKDGVVYEVLDKRKREDPLTGYAMLEPVPDGFEIWPYMGVGERLILEDDNQLEELPTVSTFYMPDGEIHFIPLTLEDFKRLGGPKKYKTPEFKSTDDLQEYLRVRIEAV